MLPTRKGIAALHVVAWLTSHNSTYAHWRTV